MTVKEIAFRLEELQIKSWALNSLALAVNDAITAGLNAASSFEGVLYVLVNMTHELEGEMKELSDALFKVVRSEKKEVV